MRIGPWVRSDVSASYQFTQYRGLAMSTHSLALWHAAAARLLTLPLTCGLAVNVLAGPRRVPQRRAPGLGPFRAGGRVLRQAALERPTVHRLREGVVLSAGRANEGALLYGWWANHAGAGAETKTRPAHDRDRKNKLRKTSSCRWTMRPRTGSSCWCCGPSASAWASPLVAIPRQAGPAQRLGIPRITRCYLSLVRETFCCVCLFINARIEPE
jgi:hypothetical protein